MRVPVPRPVCRTIGPLALLLVALLSPHTLRAAPPPAMQPPDETTARVIREKTDQLGRELADLRRTGLPDGELTDVEVSHKAAVWIAAHAEWYKDYAKWTGPVLDQGLNRAAELKPAGTRGNEAAHAPWLKQTGTVFRGYRSALDGSVQPYKVVLPRDYPDGPPGEKLGSKLWRLDLILHGRDDTLTEVKFLHPGDSPKPGEQDYVELHVYGRGNNAFRWAGERDAFEALDAFRAGERTARGRDTIDPRRIVLRGFSMGGAGAWHLGLHHPGFWCSVSPGAGFTTTYGREKNPGGKLPDYVVKCLGIYDAIDYAENVFDVPVVAYGGEKDPQLEASKAIQDKLRSLEAHGVRDLHATFLVGPGMGHKYDPDSLATLMRLQGEQAETGKPAYPPRVRFVTMTPKYADCFWVTVLRQEKQYERSLVDAERAGEGFRVKTENVRALRLALPEDWRGRANVKIEIDGREVEARSEEAAVLLEKGEAGWSQADGRQWAAGAAEGRWKSPGLTGPVDDAFTGPFLCVRGTGKPWHPEVQRQADADLKRFADEWSKWFRGELPIKDDVQVTQEDMGSKNLVLFGDPSSNALIAKALARLPLKWTAETLTVAGHDYAAATHLPALVYPSPFVGGHYLVLNSGHTFHDAEFKDTNRMLYPRLGDWAVLRVGEKEGAPSTPADVAAAGLFDEQWR